MGKRITSQARGKGGPKYRAPSHNYFGKIVYAGFPNKPIRGEVIDIVNSVGHSAPLMFVEYENGESALLPAPLGIKVGEQVWTGEKAPPKIGCVLKIKDIPTGTNIYNIELRPFDGGKLIRSSGCAAQIVGEESGKILVRLPSNKLIKLNPNCRATIGVIAGGGRIEKPFVKGGKRHIALRARGKLHPIVSGVAKNAVDHPHGGTHRRVKGGPSTVSRNAPPGAKVGLIAPKKTGRGK